MKIFRLSVFLYFCLLMTMASAQKPAAKKPANAPLRVMSYNIRYATKTDSINYWDNRKSKVAGLLRYHQADLIGVQEALHRQLTDLEKDLPEFAWYGVGRDDGKISGEFSAIYYRKNRFKPLDKGTFWLSETPEKPGSKNWDAAITRLCSWVKFQDLKTGHTFFHFNTHYDHMGKIAREKSSEILVAKIKAIAGTTPVVITGDFNVPQTAPAYATMINGTTIKDAQFISETPHYGPLGTSGGFLVNRPLKAKIDYVFVKGPIRVLQHAVITDQWDNYYPSDHLPVLAEIEIK